MKQTQENPLYSVWCEWDIGQAGCIFPSEDDANNWIRDNWMQELGDLEEAKDQGLIVVEDVEIIRHSNMAQGVTEVTLVNVYGAVMDSSNGCQPPRWFLTPMLATRECGDDIPIFMVETFEGSNIHLKAIEYSKGM